MKLQLINPPPFQRLERYHDTPDYTRLGLACLAAAARRQGAECDIVDSKYERLDLEQTVARVLRFEPHVVGLTAFTNEVKQAAAVAALIRRRRPRIRLALGGVHVTALPRRTLEEFPCFDFGVVGEGELTLEELLGALARGGDLSAIDGLAWREGARVRVNAPRAGVPDLDDLPSPAWDLLPPSPEVLVMTTRGCPFCCPFCMNPNGRKVRRRSVDRIMAELRGLADRPGCERFLFCDEIFAVDRARTEELLDAMIAAGLHRRVRSFAQTHVNVVDAALFSKMKQAGFYCSGFGIETGDARGMEKLGKGLSMDRVFAARRAAREAELPVEGYFILGQPDETWRSAVATIRLAITLDVDLPVFGLMVPYPGTEIARMAARGEGGYRLRSEDWNDYNKQLGDALEFEHLGRSQLELLQLLGYLAVFLFNRRFSDLLGFVWQYRSEGLGIIRKLLSPRRIMELVAGPRGSDGRGPRPG